MLQNKLRLLRYNMFTRRNDNTILGMFTKSFSSEKLEQKYSTEEKEKIMNIINTSDEKTLSHYDITKARLKNIYNWKLTNGSMKSFSDIEMVEGFTEKTVIKFFNSILKSDPSDSFICKYKLNQILSPHLSENIIKSSKTVLAVYTAVNSVSWSLIQKDDYTLTEWEYYPNEEYERRKILITDILDTAWKVFSRLPQADIYVMKSEATTLRAGGSDPNNPKILAVNLQKAQLVSMLIALLNYRSNILCVKEEEKSEEKLQQKVFFLRSNLPFRLFGTLIGNEQVSTDQTIENLLPTYSKRSGDKSHVYIPENIINNYRSKSELEKDMLGRCLFLALTFMDLCVHKNKNTASKL